MVFHNLLYIDYKDKRFWLSATGLFLGVFIFLFSLQILFLIQKINKSEGEYLVISKNVTALNLISQSSLGFTQKEIEELQKLESVNDVGEFTSSKFSSWLSLNIGGKNLFQTYVPLEAIPSQFIDVEIDEMWNWNKSSKVIPIIIPKNYIDIYNFAFAPSQGAPPISEGIVSAKEFKLTLAKGNKRAFFKMKIVGFSKRINTILVPLSFIEYGNKNFSNEKNIPINRLIIEASNKKSPELLDFLNQKKYQNDQDSKQGNKVYQIAKIVFISILIIGLIILFLSLVILMIYSENLILKAKPNIIKMLQIGYFHENLATYFHKSLVKSLLIILFSSFTLFTLIYAIFVVFFMDRIGDNTILPLPSLATICIFTLLSLLIYVNSKRQINLRFKKISPK